MFCYVNLYHDTIVTTQVCVVLGDLISWYKRITVSCELVSWYKCMNIQQASPYNLFIVWACHVMIWMSWVLSDKSTMRNDHCSTTDLSLHSWLQIPIQDMSMHCQCIANALPWWWFQLLKSVSNVIDLYAYYQVLCSDELRGNNIKFEWLLPRHKTDDWFVMQVNWSRMKTQVVTRDYSQAICWSSSSPEPTLLTFASMTPPGTSSSSSKVMKHLAAISQIFSLKV